MLLNGQPYELDRARPLAEVLTLRGYDLARVAVLLNQRVAPRNQLSQIEVQNEDTLEVVAFVGGG
ncbi:MAG: sulfur carrier protein ThiS [Deltaproteobacteria bacterium]|nr:sulfur carrier protein ThiS [Deltaproteobacteria bacterium]